MDNNKKIDPILQKIKHLEDRVKNLEKMLDNKNLNPSVPNLPAKKYDYSGKKQITNKSNAKNEFLVTVDAHLNLNDEEGNTYKVSEEECVKNMLVMGDTLLINVTDSKVNSIKVSQRAKRIKEEALVISKDSNFYAVSKFATHKLLNYDVTSRGVLKGFEVKLLLPKNKEKQAVVSVIDFVEGSGGLNAKKINTYTGEIYTQSTPNLKTDIRVVADDDLV